MSAAEQRQPRVTGGTLWRPPRYKPCMSAALRRDQRLTLPAFIAWESADGLRYELVDGAPRAMAPAGNVHNFLQGELLALIRAHLREQRPECEVLPNPGVVPHLLSAHNFRIPDLGVTCARLVPGREIPDPVLLVEILSPSNPEKTWSNLWAYTSIPSVREILILESARIGAELLRRGSDGAWPSEPDAIGAGTLVLESIGFALPLRSLYARSGVPSAG